MYDTHAKYPNKTHPVRWDSLNREYPVNKAFDTGRSSVNLVHSYRGPPEVLSAPRRLHEDLTYERDLTADWHRLASQSTVDFTHKQPEHQRFNKHTSCAENQYIAHPSLRLSDRSPASRVHGTTEARDRYRRPSPPPSVTFDTYRRQLGSYGFAVEDPPVDYTFDKHLETIDTTEESFVIHLDPYVTTSRQHHRPFTAAQLARPSNTRDIVTYHTLSTEPWVRTRKPCAPDIRPHTSAPMADRETFKHTAREVRTHNKMTWVPGSFRTEVSDNYKRRPPIPNNEHSVKHHYDAAIARMATDVEEMREAVRNSYWTEHNHTGSGKPLSAWLAQHHVGKNKRLEKYTFR